jgi:hypothetical protein
MSNESNQSHNSSQTAAGISSHNVIREFIVSLDVGKLMKLCDTILNKLKHDDRRDDLTYSNLAYVVPIFNAETPHKLCIYLAVNLESTNHVNRDAIFYKSKVFTFSFDVVFHDNNSIRLYSWTSRNTFNLLDVIIKSQYIGWCSNCNEMCLGDADRNVDEILCITCSVANLTISLPPKNVIEDNCALCCNSLNTGNIVKLCTNNHYVHLKCYGQLKYHLFKDPRNCNCILCKIPITISRGFFAMGGENEDSRYNWEQIPFDDDDSDHDHEDSQDPEDHDGHDRTE